MGLYHLALWCLFMSFIISDGSSQELSGKCLFQVFCSVLSCLHLQFDHLWNKSVCIRIEWMTFVLLLNYLWDANHQSLCLFSALDSVHQFPYRLYMLLFTFRWFSWCVIGKNSQTPLQKRFNLWSKVFTFSPSQSAIIPSFPIKSPDKKKHKNNVLFKHKSLEKNICWVISHHWDQVLSVLYLSW